MRIIKNNYYYFISELEPTWIPNVNIPHFEDFALGILDITDEDWKNPAFAIDDANVEKLWQLCVARYYENAIIKITKCLYDEAPTSEEIEEAMKKWLFKFINAISMSYDYYNTLLTAYASAQSHLLDDITATSRNKVKFNDTPQNPNNLNVYEGDNYLTHFTSTEGESSSPLMSKIMRLKEIQDHYKDVMDNWVSYMRKCWFE